MHYNACIINMYVPREVKNQRTLVKRTSRIMKYGQDKYKICYDVKTDVHNILPSQMTRHQKLNSFWVMNSLGTKSVHTAPRFLPKSLKYQNIYMHA